MSAALTCQWFAAAVAGSEAAGSSVWREVTLPLLEGYPAGQLTSLLTWAAQHCDDVHRLRFLAPIICQVS
jgi:hypothetical protein